MWLHGRYRCVVGWVLLFALPVFHGCASYSRLYPSGAPDNSLRVVQVVELRTASDVRKEPSIYEPLAAAGIRDAEIRDWSVGSGTVHCCGWTTMISDQFFYVPVGMRVELGDIVVIRCGSQPKDGKSSVNTVVRVVQKKNDSAGSCRWEPEAKGSMQILYCDWMPEQGWVKYKAGTFEETWVKPAGP